MLQKMLCAIGGGLLLMQFAACAAKVEDCTDPIAENFNAEADINCCCEYYQLQLQCRHFGRDTSEVLQLGGSFFDPQGAAFRVDALQMLLSEVQLIDYDGNAHSIEDTLLFELRDGSQALLPDDARALNSEGLRYELGKFSRVGDYAALRFRIGLSPLAAGIDGEQVSPSTHPLGAAASPIFWDSTNQRYNSYLFAFHDSNLDTTYSLLDSTSFSVEIPVELSVRDGADSNIFLDISYMQILFGVDLANDAPATVRAKVQQNLQQRVFALRP